jgi:hypothetical protein
MERTATGPGRRRPRSKCFPAGAIVAAIAGAVLADAARAVPIVTEASGSGVAAIVAARDAFRSALGPLNPNVAGSLGSGRREINWDGVPDARSAPNPLPADFFNAVSPRGVEFSTPGTGFQLSANAGSSAPIEFGNIEGLYPSIFTPFSPQRLFTAIGSNVLDVSLFVPGTTTVATVSAFGAVFTDVDTANLSSLEFFDASNQSLGVFFAPAAAGDETLSFLGVAFTEERVSRVRITAGDTALGPGVVSGDLVALDDFIYAEPIAAAAAPIPEPSTAVLAALGLAAMAFRLRHFGRRPMHAPF